MNGIDLARQLCLMVVAQVRDPMSDISKRFQDDPSPMTAGDLVVPGVVVVVIALVLWRLARRVAMSDGRSYFHSKRLFAELCQTHGLDWPHRRLLRQLAVARDAANPARVFVEPTWFQTAAIPVPLRPYRQEIEELRKQLFDADAS